MMTDKSSKEWERYYSDLAAHEEYIKKYRHFLDKITSYLEWKRPNHTWTTDEIKNVMTAEIDMKSSCDAPNKPGYYRANND